MLPPGVDKASGVWAALQRARSLASQPGRDRQRRERPGAVRASPEHAVAVQNADDAREARRGSHHGGRLLRRIPRAGARSDRDGSGDAMPRHKVTVGVRENGSPVEITPCRDSLLVHGPDGSGKAALCNRLLEQFLASSYQCCVIDADVGGTAGAGRGAGVRRCARSRRGSPTFSPRSISRRERRDQSRRARRRNASGVHRGAAGAAAGAARPCRPAALS